VSQNLGSRIQLAEQPTLLKPGNHTVQGVSTYENQSQPERNRCRLVREPTRCTLTLLDCSSDLPTESHGPTPTLMRPFAVALPLCPETTGVSAFECTGVASCALCEHRCCTAHTNLQHHLARRRNASENAYSGVQMDMLQCSTVWHRVSRVNRMARMVDAETV